MHKKVSLTLKNVSVTLPVLLGMKALMREVFFFVFYYVNLGSAVQLKHSCNFHGSERVVHKTKTRGWDAELSELQMLSPVD